MSYLLRRTKKALAGWRDDFNRPAENPIKKPWASWGDPRTIITNGGSMELGNDGGWFQPNPNGGVAYEHQPLTPNWGLKFYRWVYTTGDGRHAVYLDRNWTEGINGQRYQLVMLLERDTTEDDEGNDDVDRTLRIYGRDTNQWIQFGGFNMQYSMTQAEWTSNLEVEIIVLRDMFLTLYVGGAPRAQALIPENYRPGPRKRSANFTQLTGGKIAIDNFETWDRSPLRTFWTEEFYDDFDRPNSNSVDNGWSQGGGQFGILNGALSMQTPFPPPGDGYRGIWRGELSSGNMRIEATLGGGTGDPNLIAECALLGRINAAGTSGLGAFIFRGTVYISTFSGAIGTTNPSFTQRWSRGGFANIVNGDKIAFCIDGDEAWIERVNTGELLAWVRGINAYTSVNNRHHGAFVRRMTFTNSPPLGDYRAFAA